MAGWNCPRCTLLNAPQAKQCDACSYSPTTSNTSSSAAAWSCSQCTFSNTASAQQCAMCNSPRSNPSAEPARGTSNWGWRCPRCTFDNEVGSPCCDACGHDVNALTARSARRSTNMTPEGEAYRRKRQEDVSAQAGQTGMPHGEGWLKSSHLEQQLQQQEKDASRHITNLCSLSRAANLLFSDDAFPACDASLYGDGRHAHRGKGGSGRSYTWKRPKQLGGSWMVIGNSISPEDIVQGELGDCWFLSALSVLADRPHLIDRILLTKKYNPEGAYAVRFFHNGDWKRVVVDDQFPTIYNQFAYGRCAGNALWVPIIEKAYAKLHGSYSAIVAGLPINALFDLTGAPCESINLEKDDLDLEMLWARLLSFQQSCFLMGAACGRRGATEQYLSQMGLVGQHAYSVVDVRAEDGHKLVKLRNPWGRREWNGDWGRKSKRWTREWKQRLDYYEGSGTFWMAYGDFVVHFSSIDVCKEQATWYSLGIPTQFPDAVSFTPNHMFELVVVSSTWMFAMLIQNDKDGARPVDFQDLGLLVVDARKGVDDFSRQWPLTPLWPALGRVASIDFLTQQGKGSYLILPFSTAARQQPLSYTFAIYSANPVFVRPLPYNPLALRINLNIALTNAMRPQQLGPGLLLYTLHQGSAIFVAVSNQSSSQSAYVEMDCTGSNNLTSSRKSLKVKDVIPPRSTQLIMVLTQQVGTMSYMWKSEYRVQALGPMQIFGRNKEHVPPLLDVLDLHEPQAMRQSGR